MEEQKNIQQSKNWSQITQDGNKEEMVTNDFRTLENWNNDIKIAKNKYSLHLVVALSMEEFCEAIKKFMKIQPIAITRVKKERNVWRLIFSPEQLDSLKSIKQKEQFLFFGNLKIKNLDYCPIPDNKWQYKQIWDYVIEVDPLVPMELIEQKLLEQKVELVWIAREKYKGFEMGTLAIKSYSKHKDGEVQIQIEENQYKMLQLQTKILRIRTSKRTNPIGSTIQKKKNNLVGKEVNKPVGNQKGSKEKNDNQFHYPKKGEKLVWKRKIKSIEPISTKNRFEQLEGLEEEETLQQSKIDEKLEIKSNPIIQHASEIKSETSTSMNNTKLDSKIKLDVKFESKSEVKLIDKMDSQTQKDSNNKEEKNNPKINEIGNVESKSKVIDSTINKDSKKILVGGTKEQNKFKLLTPPKNLSQNSGPKKWN